jgi:protein-L-isoaspartate(D-aspartate) O-methyltransferase
MNLAHGVGLDSSAVRQSMVSKLAQQGMTDAAVLQAMGSIERHRFVDTALVNQAYEDTSLPIGLGQTIPSPGGVATSPARLARAIQVAWDGYCKSAPVAAIRRRC